MLPSSVPPRKIKLERLRAHSGDRTQRAPLLSCRGSSPGHLTVGGEKERKRGRAPQKARMEYYSVQFRQAGSSGREGGELQIPLQTEFSKDQVTRTSHRCA